MSLIRCDCCDTPMRIERDADDDPFLVCESATCRQSYFMHGTELLGITLPVLWPKHSTPAYIRQTIIPYQWNRFVWLADVRLALGALDPAGYSSELERGRAELKAWRLSLNPWRREWWRAWAGYLAWRIRGGMARGPASFTRFRRVS
jgi:hypothetical protein